MRPALLLFLFFFFLSVPLTCNFIILVLFPLLFLLYYYIIFSYSPLLLFFSTFLSVLSNFTSLFPSSTFYLIFFALVLFLLHLINHTIILPVFLALRVRVRVHSAIS